MRISRTPTHILQFTNTRGLGPYQQSWPVVDKRTTEVRGDTNLQVYEGYGLVVLTAKYEIIEVRTKPSTCLKVISDWTKN